MTTQALDQKWPDAIGFSRLHALAKRGYRPLFGLQSQPLGHAFVELVHPRTRGRNVPPPVTLWSDGIISTSGVLWPEKYVPTEDGPPDWQRFISPEEADRFDSFTSSVEVPGIVDLYVLPALRNAKIFSARLLLGSTLCIVLAAALKLTMYFI